MDIEFDPAKDAINTAKHGVSLQDASRLKDLKIIGRDERRDYGEDRYIAVGTIGKRLYVLIFTPRREKIRLISLRKASLKEAENYET